MSDSPSRRVPDAPVESAWIDQADCDELLSKPLKLLVAVDGSEPSKVALSYVTDAVMQQDRNTYVEVLHAFSDSKEYLPPAFRKEQIKALAEAKLTSSVSTKRWGFTLLQQEQVPAALHITGLAKSLPADFICLGFYGRKGKKDKHMVGSNVTQVLLSTNASVVVIKDEDARLLPVGRPTKFVVSVSLNKASTKGFLDALRLSKPGDEIHVVYVKSYLERTESDYTTDLRAKYSSFFAGLADGKAVVLHRYHDRQTEFHLIQKERLETTPQAVVRYADSIDADFIVVGTNALRVDRGKSPVGSVSMEICMETDRNFVVAKWVDVSRKVRGSLVR